jgi:hypothetical protein
MKTIFNGRLVEMEFDIVGEDLVPRLLAASYVSTGDELSDIELDELSDSDSSDSLANYFYGA